MPTSDYYADTHQAATCRSCGAAIEFAENVRTHKRMPFNAPILPQQTRFEPDTHRVIEKVDLAHSHFATCPNSAQHRRSR